MVAIPSSTPLRTRGLIRQSGAGGGNRTRTPLSRPGILSPVRLPVSPPRRVCSIAREFAIPAISATSREVRRIARSNARHERRTHQPGLYRLHTAPCADARVRVSSRSRAHGDADGFSRSLHSCRTVGMNGARAQSEINVDIARARGCDVDVPVARMRVTAVRPDEPEPTNHEPANEPTNLTTNPRTYEPTNLRTHEPTNPRTYEPIPRILASVIRANRKHVSRLRTHATHAVGGL
jgi:hypothetical protein